MKVNYLQLAESLLTDGKNLSMRVIGGSMSPILMSGDTIYIESIKATDLSAGDIVLFKRGDSLVAHRIIEITSRPSAVNGGELLFLTKGDTFSSPDFPVSDRDIVGRIYAVKKHGRTFDMRRGIFSSLNKLAHKLSPFTSFLFDKVRRCRSFGPHRRVEGMETRSRVHLFIISLLKTALSDKSPDPDIFETMRGTIDFSRALRMARDNGVSQQLYVILKQYPDPLIEDESETWLRAQLRKDYLATAAKNTMLYSEFKRVIKGFGERQIDVISMKGAALAELIYQDIGIREMSDIDLLIKRDDLAKANTVLEKIGYTATDPSPFDGLDNKNNYLATRDYRSQNPAHPSFHMHWHIVNSSVPAPYSSQINMQEIWDNALPGMIAGVPVLSMSPFHFLIHLSEHAMRVTHSASRLIHFLDIASLVTRYKHNMDWHKVVETSKNYGVDKFVYYALSLCRLNFDPGMPEWVFDKLKPVNPGIGERLFFNFTARGNGFSGLSYPIHFSMNKGLVKKAAFIFRTLFPPYWVLVKRNAYAGGSLSAPPRQGGRTTAPEAFSLHLERLKEVMFHKISIMFMITAALFFLVTPGSADERPPQINSSYTLESGQPEYLIAADDLLEIDIWQGFEVKKYDVTVKPNGFVTVGIVEAKVSEMTTGQAEAALKKALSEYIREPKVEVLVKEYRGRTVTLLGAILGKGPGIYPLKGKTTLSKLIITAGGFAKDADMEKVQITKPDGTISKINLFRVMFSGDTAHDVIVDSGDTIYIPATEGERSVFIFGEVNNPGAYKLSPGLTLLQVIGMTKGYKDTAVIDDVRVIRGGLEKPQLIAADIKAMLEKGDLTKDIQLQKNDIIYIPRSRIGNWNAFIAKLKPTMDFLIEPIAGAFEYQQVFAPKP